jgi:peptide/nickel transport system substrate-binding protein
LRCTWNLCATDGVRRLVREILGLQLDKIQPMRRRRLRTGDYWSLLTRSERAFRSLAPATGNRKTGPALLRAASAVALILAAPALAEDLLTTKSPLGRYGGDLIVAERSEPKTLNPVTATDGVSRELIQLMTADLVHINRESQQPEPALASVITSSADRRRYTLQLRRGLRFSDGAPFDADDVLFTFQVYLDEKIHSPQRDLLFTGSRPVSVHKVDAYDVVFEFSEPYAPGDRLFDSIAILPRHLLARPYADGTLINVWGMNAGPREIAGLGPFRLKEQVPGQRVVLERNPYYWKQDSAHKRLPYLQNVIFEYAGSEDGQILRFQTGASDIISRPSPRDFERLAKQGNASGRKLVDLGPGLEYSFLFFNLNVISNGSSPQLATRQLWFRDVNFRRAVSAAIDREAIARIVYAGRATPIWTHVTPGNKLWINSNITGAPHSQATARSILTAAGFTWDEKGLLLDRARHPVEFSVITNSGNNERAQMATIIQRDLEELGMAVHIVSLEFRSMLDRITKTFDYDACILGLVSGDVDPGAEMNVWPSGGSAHFWNLRQSTPATPWEAEIDRLMAAQMLSLDSGNRKRSYDRVQQLVAEYLPVLCLVSPNVLAGARTGLNNFRPVILPPHILWNAEEIYWQSGSR